MFPLYDLNPHRRFPWVTLLLIAANVVILAAEGLEPSVNTVYRFGFIPKRVSELDSGKPLVVLVPQQDPRARGRNPLAPTPVELSTAPADVYLTFFTTMFLHGNWLHLVMNMWMLWVFGNNIEDRLGRFMFICYYLLGGLVGTVCQWASDPLSTMPVIGASGAVATVLGGYAITYPKALVKTLIFFGLILIIDLPALVVLGIWFLLQMAAAGLKMLPGVPGEHVAFWAHIGGFLAGIALMPIFGLGAAPAESDWKREVQELFHFDDPRSRVE